MWTSKKKSSAEDNWPEQEKTDQVRKARKRGIQFASQLIESFVKVKTTLSD